MILPAHAELQSSHQRIQKRTRGCYDSDSRLSSAREHVILWILFLLLADFADSLDAVWFDSWARFSIL